MTKSSVILLFRSLPDFDNGSQEFDLWEELGEQSNFDYNYIVYVCFHYVMLAFSLATFIYGAISWSLIRKFRNITNYVFITTAFNNVIHLTFVSATILHREMDIGFFSLIYTYLKAVHENCLLVICYMFYVDIVKVFRKETKKKFLKVSLFIWVGPLIVILGAILLFVVIIFTLVQDVTAGIVLFFVFLFIIIVTTLTPTITNWVLFFKIVWSLFWSKPSNDVAMSTAAKRKDRLQRLCIATSILVLSNTLVLILTILSIFDFWEKIAVSVDSVVTCLQIVVVSLFVPFMKKNRVVWREYLDSRVLWTLP